MSMEFPRQHSGGPVARWSRGLRKWRGDFDRHLEALEGPEAQFDVRPEVAMLDLFLERQIHEAEERDCPGWRGALRELAQQCESDPESVPKLVKLALDGASETQARDELRPHLERRARLVLQASDSTTRRAEVVTRAQAVQVFTVWLTALREEMDAQHYARVAPKLLRLVSGIGVEEAMRDSNAGGGS